ncbi:UDP-N-acetylmuramoyl-L-alanyl-D-glutamate--2,6-diaminopimelate ligase [Candidatus Woesebacteria bacterium]|nr:UDP-N-acetylmuramoyl-L-alanyl-D-glutamate--2,6-diaminopimelate ligase [Candidatus Woesebacteria bacterium]
MLGMIIYKIKRLYHLVKTGLLEGVPEFLRSQKTLRALTIIGITGTDGKTTTSTLLRHLLESADLKVGLISTIGGYVDGEVINTGFHVTSPGPRDLYRMLRLMHQKGCTHVVLEATSHGLYQHRFWGIRPLIAGVTNVTHEHLDYHQTWNEYARAKLLLLSRAKHVYLNDDDESKAFFHRHTWSKNQTAHYYSRRTALPKIVKKAIDARFPEIYNRSNAILASLIAQKLGVTDEHIAKAIPSFKGVPGRMEIVSKTPIKIIVDFAHTPNALEQLLRAVRKSLPASARLIVVFGCAGHRDKQKRPMMGEIAARLADTAIFTAEDPRTEDVWAIMRQMKSGIKVNHNHVITLADRREAIHFALKSVTQSGDCIVVSGKGHEESMCFGTEEVPWNDSAVIKELLRSKRA